MVSIVKDKTDLDSWFSAKPIIVGNLSNILVGTELNLRQDVYIHIKRFPYMKYILFCTYRGIVKILPECIRTRKGKDNAQVIWEYLPQITNAKVN